MANIIEEGPSAKQMKIEETSSEGKISNVVILMTTMHLSMYCPTTPPSGVSGALQGELTRNCCPTMGHLTIVH